MFDELIEPNDILQGELGDCWFMCALACLAERPQLVRRLFIMKEKNNEGIYRVRFCKNGTWVTVTIDDYFPCYPVGEYGAGTPIFSRTKGNELWVIILEKAYAKLHGSYCLLEDGNVFQGMMDLTGCPTKEFDFEEEDVQDMIEDGRLWTKLKEYDQSGALISASTPGVDNMTGQGGPNKKAGLVPGHAYTIIACKEAYGNRLVNIRNPWGQFEWGGDWSDNSPLWDEDMKAALKPVLEANDGTFWMSFEDFTEHFVSANVCKVKNFQESRLRGKFQRFLVNGEPVVKSCWYYSLQIQTRTQIHVGCHQADERVYGVGLLSSYLDQGIAVFEETNGQFELIEMVQFEVQREVQKKLNLNPGKYVVLPLCMGCYLQRPLDAPSHNIQLMSGTKFHPYMRVTLQEIFNKFNFDLQEGLTYPEFSKFMETVGAVLDEPHFNDIMQQVPSTHKGITFEGFRKFWKQMICEQGEDKAWEWLDKLGYDEDLYSIKSRPIIMTFHSDEEVQIDTWDATQSNLHRLAMSALLEQSGNMVGRKGDLEVLQVLMIEAWIFGVRNLSDEADEMTLDFTGSEDLLFSTITPKVTKTIPPNSTEVFVHVQLAKNSEEGGKIKASFH